jgi:hypothetical protein
MTMASVVNGLGMILTRLHASVGSAQIKRYHLTAQMGHRTLLLVLILMLQYLAYNA